MTDQHSATTTVEATEAVAAVLADLETIGERPITEHTAILTAIHEQLYAILDRARRQ